MKQTYHNKLSEALSGENPVKEGRFLRVEKNGKFVVFEQLELPWMLPSRAAQKQKAKELGLTDEEAIDFGIMSDEY